MSNYKKYKLSQEQYEQLLKIKGNQCWICGSPPKNRDLNIDHNHNLGFKPEAVRGLLCFMCNYKLVGKMGDRPDSVERFRKAADYLENYRKHRKSNKKIFEDLG